MSYLLEYWTASALSIWWDTVPSQPTYWFDREDGLCKVSLGKSVHGTCNRCPLSDYLSFHGCDVSRMWRLSLVASRSLFETPNGSTDLHELYVTQKRRYKFIPYVDFASRPTRQWMQGARRLMPVVWFLGWPAGDREIGGLEIVTDLSAGDLACDIGDYPLCLQER